MREAELEEVFCITFVQEKLEYRSGTLEYSYPTLRLKLGLVLPCRRVVSDVRDLAESVVRWRGGDVLVHDVTGAGAEV